MKEGGGSGLLTCAPPFCLQERAAEAEAHLQILRDQQYQKPAAKQKKPRPSSAMKASGKVARRGGGASGVRVDVDCGPMAIAGMPESHRPWSPATSSSEDSSQDPQRSRHHQAISLAPPDLS